MYGKFRLLSHIDSSAPTSANDPLWDQTDYFVLSWLYGSVADDILDITMEPDQTARAFWVAIEALFCDNKEPLGIFLGNQFHSLVQGDLSISEYSQRLRMLANSLHDVGHAVSELQIVLNMLRYFNPRLSNTADDIVNVTLFPSFSKARSMLALKELRLSNEIKVAFETALIASASSTSCGPSGCCTSAPNTPSNK